MFDKDKKFIFMISKPLPPDFWEWVLLDFLGVWFSKLSCPHSFLASAYENTPQSFPVHTSTDFLQFLSNLFIDSFEWSSATILDVTIPMLR